MERFKFLFGFFLAICLYVAVYLPLVFFVHHPYQRLKMLRRSTRLQLFMRDTLEGLAMNARNTARAIPLSAAALAIIMGVISATNGYTIPNLFDMSNTPFYFFIGLMAGTAGMGMAFFLEVVDSITE